MEMETLLPPFNIPSPTTLLITDTLPSPASFLLHRLLSSHLKSKPPTSNSNSNSDSNPRNATPTTATIISISEDLSKWKAIASKSNINLTQHITTNSLKFIEALNIVHPPSPQSLQSQPSLRPLFDAIVESLPPKSSSSHLVILDDITTLEWIGFSLIDISRFSRALVAACRKADATLVIRHHITTPDLDDLFRKLLQLCTYHLEVLSLASGRSGAVSGEIALHAGPSTEPSQVKLLPRSAALQYHLSDTGATFFERGTGIAVL